MTRANGARPRSRLASLVSGFVVYLIVVVPLGGLLAAWGFVLRRRGHGRAGMFMLAWGAGGPYVAPSLTGLTWLLLGDAAPESPDEPWPYAAAVALYSMGVSFAVSLAAVFAGLAAYLGDVSLPEERR